MLYLIDEPLADLGLRTADGDGDAHVVLIQDGVLLDVDLDVPTYAVERDVVVRGVEVPEAVEVIDYDEVIQLLEEFEVRSFV